MGIQALVVFVGLAIALIAGVFTAPFESGARVAGWLAIGLVPVLSALLHVTERVIGREIWHYRAPYPYRRMKVATVAEVSRLPTAAESEVTGVDAEEIRLAA